MRAFLFVLAIFAAGVALAHEGVKNPAVMARMHGMKDMGAASKVLGDMVKGKTAFDAAGAEAAMDKLRGEAARVAPLFEAQEDDPKSEALPVIWEQFADFTEKAEALSVAANAPVGSLDEVKAALPQIGAACKACHKAYRE